MPGWIIQGVRGEGKSLAAVGKIKEYMSRGRPVATNLNLFLEHLLPADNKAIAYRLPDHPRLVDFQILPPAYDPKYKKDDMNGLLVLDELGTWLNSRNWNDKSRLELLNWLFLSRKDHWDLILLAQDHEMIDSQVRTTLCDFLVQASRLDRVRIPYIGSLLKAIGFTGNMGRVHRYSVHYGMSTATPPQDYWTFTGKEFYNGYDTNQKFLNGLEPLCGTLVDMRATYSYIPASHLTGHVFIERLNQQINDLRKHFQIKTVEGLPVAKKGAGLETNYLKIALLAGGLVILLGWKYLSGGLTVPAASASLTPVVQVPQMPTVSNQSSSETKAVSETEYAALETDEFMDYLLKKFRPRLSVSAFSPDGGFFGDVDFYDSGVLVERYPISTLHSLGVSLIHRPYGADLIYRGKAFIVTAWKLPSSINIVASNSVTSHEKIN